MATLGVTSVGSGPRALNAAAKGIRATMPEAGSAGVSIFAYIEDTGGAGDSFAAAIVDGGDLTTVLANSAVRTNIGAAGWYEFTGSTLASFTPSNGASLLLVIASLSAAGAGAYNSDLGLDGYAGATNVNGLNPLTFTGSATFVSDALRDYSVYMQYTPAGGGGGTGRVPFVR
jgi:hypothetical protein